MPAYQLKQEGAERGAAGNNAPSHDNEKCEKSTGSRFLAFSRCHFVPTDGHEELRILVAECYHGGLLGGRAVACCDAIWDVRLRDDWNWNALTRTMLELVDIL